MRIGDEVLIKGTINEIRKDIVIIENEGGYFGTVPSEIVPSINLQEPKTIQEKQAESERYQKAYDDGYANGYSQARFDYEPKTDTLDKIRAEIDEQYDRVHPYNISCAEGLEMALEIIDKYRAETE